MHISEFWRMAIPINNHLLVPVMPPQPDFPAVFSKYLSLVFVMKHWKMKIMTIIISWIGQSPLTSTDWVKCQCPLKGLRIAQALLAMAFDIEVHTSIPSLPVYDKEQCILQPIWKLAVLNSKQPKFRMYALCSVMWQCPLKRTLGWIAICSTSTRQRCSPLVAMPPEEVAQAKMSCWWHWPLEELAFLSSYR